MSSALASLFLLNPDITFLNFGSFGASPKVVFDDYQKWQRELEWEPVQFFAVNGPEYLKASRIALGNYLNANADDLVYVPNPTFAVNIIANTLRLKENDEVLTTNIEYGAMDRTWKFYCNKVNAKFIRQSISLPILSKESFLEEFWNGYTEKTKVVFISHITSATGLVLPVKEIIEEAKKRGLMTIIDGAHVPGHLKLDLKELDADIYTGACHKWMMTPKGSTFLYVRKSLQIKIEPLVVSWGYDSDTPSDSQFLDYHQFNGTRDFSAYLTIPKAIEFMQEHKWWEVSDSCKKMVRENALRFCDLTGFAPLAPLTEDFFGQLFSIQVSLENPREFQKMLFDKYQIEIPVMQQNDKVYIRYSINGFNSQKDLDRLYDALKVELM
ncbi:MAG: aminotransferase class V-fold PLP-dependent enzyme [Bacteroidia bacterium]|nr:aminotransferase class V-fold PLP-dependent enzyme [Bacteroidia bacterium]